ncbi:conserved hypothetical protein [Tenacibaculum sediminilitoris]|uniref:hypothetical protein n=1 Tax=Tenacibaculum sediminilitoris TaxID=1820334 RepID=UPI0038962057
MFLFKKVKAGALQYVLVVSVIIAILILTFITLMHLHQKVKLKGVLYKKSIENVQYTFDLLETQKINNDNTTKNQLDNTTTTFKNWGIYKIAHVTTTKNNEFFEKVGLLGGFKQKKKALYLQENNKPLAVVGNTKIIGDANIPKLGIKRGNIAGTSYNSNTLLYGKSTLSSTKLPEIENISVLKEYFSSALLNSKVSFFELEEGKHFKNSFKKETLVYNSNYPIYLRNISLTGNILIKSNSNITIHSSAILEDVIVIAPKIIIQNRVKGIFQAFAKDTIEVKSNTTLNYPSALVVVNENKIDNNNSPEISIDDNCQIKGSILLYSTSESMNFNPQVHIKEKTTITGEIYCNQNLELMGTVYGSVYTNHFLTKQFGSTYINHLYHAEINSTKLPIQFCGLPLEHQKYTVAKWLY